MLLLIHFTHLFSVHSFSHPVTHTSLLWVNRLWGCTLPTSMCVWTPWRTACSTHRNPWSPPAPWSTCDSGSSPQVSFHSIIPSPSSVMLLTEFELTTWVAWLSCPLCYWIVFVDYLLSNLIYISIEKFCWIIPSMFTFIWEDTLTLAEFCGLLYGYCGII